MVEKVLCQLLGNNYQRLSYRSSSTNSTVCFVRIERGSVTSNCGVMSCYMFRCSVKQNSGKQ